MDTLLALDHQLFLFINHLPHAPWSDAFAMTLSGVFGATTVIWLLLSIFLFVREERRDQWFFLPVILAGGISVLVTDILLKNYFTRNRPPLDLGAIHVGSAISGYSFPSGHATFAWAIAVVLAKKEPRAKYFFYLLAALISISRIYLGVHYPADIVAGSVLGLGVGHMVQYVHAQVKRQRASDHAGRRRSRKDH